MATEIRVPTLGESVTEATVGKWFKKPGDAVEGDEPLVELETDKVTLEVAAPAAGVLGEIAAKDGETVARRRAARPDHGRRGGAAARGAGRREARGRRTCAERPPPPPAAAAAPAETAAGRRRRPRPRCAGSPPKPASIPATVAGTGKDGRVTKGDMLAAIERAAAQPTPAPQPAAAVQVRAPSPADDAAREERVQHDPAAPDHRAPAEGGAEHRRHADDLQRGRHERGHGAAHPVQGRLREEARREARLHGLLREGLRAGAEGDPGRQRRDRRHGPRLQELLPHRRRRRHREGPRRAGGARRRQLSLAGIEKAIADFGKRARDGQLKIEEMQGGTFTISNGGVYGSLMSTPILNAPQSGILGMHKIQERPVVGRRQDRDPADDVSGALLRPPHRRRQGGGDVPGAGQGSPGGPGAAGAGFVSRHMALIAIVDGIRITVYPNDHPPPHFHAKIAEYEALFSIATGELLEGSLPRPKMEVVMSWYMAHRDEIAYLWREVELMRSIRRIDR